MAYESMVEQRSHITGGERRDLKAMSTAGEQESTYLREDREEQRSVWVG